MQLPQTTFTLDDSGFCNLQERKVLVDLILATGVQSMTHESNYLNEGSTVIWYGEIEQLSAYYPDGDCETKYSPTEFCAQFGLTWLDTTKFCKDYLDLKRKIEEIIGLPYSQAHINIDDFQGLDITDGEITYRSYRFSHRSREHEYGNFTIAFDEVNRPLDYFKNKFQAEHERMFEISRQRNIERQKTVEEREIEQLKALQKKYADKLI